MPKKSTKTKAQGIFCLEGEWEDDLINKSSVEPIFRLLADSHEEKVPYIHRNVSTKEQLEYYLTEYAKKPYREYPILYLGFHGEADTLCIGNDYEPNLDELERLIVDIKRKDPFIIYMGSCSTINVDEKRLKSFLKETGALAVIGYKGDADWMESVAAEIIILGELQGHPIIRRSLNYSKKRIIKRLGGCKMFTDLGFTMVV